MIRRSAGHALGYEPAPMINDWLVQASRAPGVASAIGIAMALTMSTRLFTQLEDALDEIWGLEPKQVEGLGRKVMRFLRRRLVAMAVVLLNLGFLFLGWYVGLLVSGRSFGPTAAFVFLLVWLYYSAQIVMLGANVTRVHARDR